MKLAKRQVAVLVAGIGLCMAQSVFAAQQKEEDSAYRWGRWAVLSPAAGGAEPYVQVATPGADFNARPGDAADFDPLVSVITPPPPPSTGGDPRDRLPPQTGGDPRDRLPPR